MADDRVSEPSLRDLATFFLKLGTIAYGGPPVFVALMEEELVRRRKWVSSRDFMDLLAVSNLLPGPTATELAIFIGYRLCGIAGLLLAGLCFVLPATLLVAAVAWAYVHYGHHPAATGLLYGVKPVVIAIVIQSTWRLGWVIVKTRLLAGLGVLMLAACFLGAGPLLVLAATAALTAGVYCVRQRRTIQAPLASILPVLPMAAGLTAAVSLTGIFLIFFKIGFVVFGGGAFLAFLQADLVVHRHWLTESQLMDALAVGQATPGPMFNTATFIGYLLAGPAGAAVATAAIFAPAFLFVAATNRLVTILLRSKLVGTLLESLNVAALALMAHVTVQLARSAVVDWTTLALAAASAAILFRFRINSIWLVAGGGVLGAVLAIYAKG